MSVLNGTPRGEASSGLGPMSNSDWKAHMAEVFLIGQTPLFDALSMRGEKYLLRLGRNHMRLDRHCCSA